MELFKRIITWFADLKLRTKLFISFGLIIVIPVSVLGFLYFNNSSEVISELARKNAFEIVKKNNQIIDTKLSKIEETTLSVVNDSDLFKTFNEVNDIENINIISMDRQVSKVISKYFASSPDIRSTVLATSYYTFGNNDVYISSENYEKSKIYSDAIEAKGSMIWEPTYDFTLMYSNPELKLSSSARFVFSAVRVINSYYLDNFIFKVLDSSIERPTLIVNFSETVLSDVCNNSVPINGTKYLIVTKSGQVVSSSEKDELSKVIDNPWLKEAVVKGSGSYTFSLDNKKYIACFDTSKVTGWISAAVVPYDELMSGITPAIKTYTLLITCICFIITIPFIYLLSSLIFSPIRKLLAAMKKMGEGNFEAKIPVARKDELGFFVEKFNRLNDKIRLLIEENYAVKLREKETEIMALNLQMNPHFLYNTLNLINWMAIEAKQEKISNIIMELCNMLVYTLKHKGDIAIFKDDIEWLQNYLHIISCRFDEKFKVNMELEPEVYSINVPKLFLQPFVENAIIHAFEYMEEGCIITITGKVDGDTVIFCVEDNGSGMSKDQIEEVMNREASSIGVRNVHKRIRLLYGEKFGVNIQSRESYGTKVFIRIPSDGQP